MYAQTTHLTWLPMVCLHNWWISYGQAQPNKGGRENEVPQCIILSHTNVVSPRHRGIGTWLMVGSCARVKLCLAVWIEYSSSHKGCQSLRNNPLQRQRPGEYILHISCLEPWPSHTIQPNPHFIATLPYDDSVGHSSYFIILCTQERISSLSTMIKT